MLTPPELTDTAVICDFDGTLAPIVDEPDRAVGLPEALDALRALVERVALVAVVSGRPVEFLHERVPVDGVALVGQYGLERRVGDASVVDQRAEPFVPAVAAAAAEAEQRWPELLVERKGMLAFTLHWRTRPNAAPEARDLDDLARRHGLLAQPGRRACELRTPVPVDKGTAVEDLLEGDRFQAALFIGDDAGDLAAFDALDRNRASLEREGLTPRRVKVGVRSAESPPELLERADVVVDGPEGVADLLRSLLPR